MPNATQIDYRRIKAEMARRGTTLRAWALKRRLSPQSVYDAASGARSGPESRRIRQRLEKWLAKTEPASA